MKWKLSYITSKKILVSIEINLVNITKAPLKIFTFYR